MKSFGTIGFINLLLFITGNCQKLNNRPIIGVLSQDDHHQSYIAASYVKYLESAGARVVPILINQNADYYSRIFNKTNGLLFPGENLDLTNSGYEIAGKILWNLAMDSYQKNNYYPIWGTGLGFELLTVLASANNTRWLTKCNLEDVAMNLDFDQPSIDPKASKLFKNADQTIINILKKENVTINYHMYCMTPENFTKSGLNQFFDILTTNQNATNPNLTFISTIESKQHPIYGVQWHPEKNPFEFTLGSKHQNVPHRYNAIIISQYMANYFVNEARKNSNKFEDLVKESEALIYNYNPKYTGKDKGSFFEQIYVFSSAKSNLWCVSFNLILFMILALSYL